MARRQTESVESTFGSDSFLDVVANIVGILIILIVLVGVRVMHAPPTPSPSDQEPSAEAKSAWERERAAIESANQQAENAYRSAVRERDEIAEENRRRLESRQREQAKIDAQWQENENEYKRRVEQGQAIAKDSARLRHEIDQLRVERDRIVREAAEQSKARAQSRDLAQDEIRNLKEQAAKLDQTVRAVKADVDAEEDRANSLRRQKEQLRQAVDEEGPKPPTKTLPHDATTLARRIQGDELHFQCKGGRLAYTYLNELLDDISEDAKKRLTATTSRLEGRVGPRGLFSLQYVLAQPTESLMQQFADGNVRWALVYAALQDMPGVGEDEEHVLDPNSAFRVKLRSSPATNYAVTLWVYPDSFRLAKFVEPFLQEAGYSVALRPIPEGVAISASPFGSASHAR